MLGCRYLVHLIKSILRGLPMSKSDRRKDVYRAVLFSPMSIQNPNITESCGRRWAGDVGASHGHGQNANHLS